ncbi:hypothetical protein MGG_17502 [Pyricularia oryzae 70-15]|uniref:Uncharacterized protein n=1 Tax=Pyricularia oryzae (strain 70-15 / ATCC MYA-4617 / FGSC 8958) TaxID=242507 RepID=G4NDM1_PYRO7|nr:uncharacterized protein MGG_17502 [Pyricularia oryzae 70-15]EHA49306.1 hypothetical protein MGG_17502 [Pyricularia oryzae 70-15]
MPTTSSAPVYVPSASRKLRKAGDTPYMSIHSLVPHPAQIPSASEKHGAPQSHYSTTAHRPRGVPRQWADHVLLSGPFGDCRAGTVLPVHVQLTNPRNGTTSSLQAIPEAFRGRTPAFPAGKVFFFFATLARIARLGLVLCASMRVARRAADRTLPSPRSVENSSKGRSVDYTWVLRGKAFRVVTVLRATG